MSRNETPKAKLTLLLLLTTACNTGVQEMPSACVRYCETRSNASVDFTLEGLNVTLPAFNSMCEPSNAALTSCVDACDATLSASGAPCLECLIIANQSQFTYERGDACETECSDEAFVEQDFRISPLERVSCWLSEDNQTTPPPVCEVGLERPRFQVTISPELASLNTTEPAQVTALDPLSLTLAQGSTVTISTLAATGLSVGQMVQAQVLTIANFSSTTEIVLRDAQGELLLYAWERGSTEPTSLPEFALRHAPETCIATNESGCTLDFNAPLFIVPSGGQEMRVEPGTTATIGRYRLVHGPSRYTPLSVCTEAQPGRTLGLLVRDDI